MRQEVRVNTNNHADSVAIVPPVVSVKDLSANNSNKTWTVPGNELWKVTRMCVAYTSSATVGNRIFTVQSEDEDGTVTQFLPAGKVQAASVATSYCCLQGIFRETAFVNGSLQVPIPADFYLPPGHVLRVYDSAAIDAAADDMEVKFQIEKLKV